MIYMIVKAVLVKGLKEGDHFFKSNTNDTIFFLNQINVFSECFIIQVRISRKI